MTSYVKDNYSYIGGWNAPASVLIFRYFPLIQTARPLVRILRIMYIKFILRAVG